MAHGPARREAITSTVVASDTKVKLLSTEYAVVHARLTISDEKFAPGAAPVVDPRTTIVSFVVHRAGEKWMCASAQATKVAVDTETVATENNGVLGFVNASADQAPPAS